MSVAKTTAMFFCLLAFASPRALADASFDALLAKADVAAGQQMSQACAMCHTFTKDGPNKIGPNLWGIVGSHRARQPDFNYSEALKAMHDKTWTFDALNQYIANPHTFAPGDKMAFAGISNAQKRANLIAWLRTLSDHPLPLPHH